jgi:hypothetical protein
MEVLPQLQFRNFSRNVVPQPQLRNRNFFRSPQLESFNSAIFGTFSAVESGRFMGKKIRGKKYRATVPLRQVFGFQRNRGFSKYFLLTFKTILS